MLTGELRNQIDGIWNDFWSGGLANPLQVIEQITYLLFLRRLDDLQTLEENKAARLSKPIERRFFPDGNDLTTRARILHRGRTLVIAATEITNAEGKQVALATGSSMYLPGRPANLLGVELGSGSSDPEDDPGA